MVLLILQLTACYHYVPVRNSVIPSGSRVSVGITDAGRVALVDRVGPGVTRIGGIVTGSTDSTLALSVSSVDYLDLSVPLRLSGEQVVVPRQFLTDVRERRLSRSRSWIAAGVLALAAGLATTLAITGFGTDEGSDRPPNGDGQTEFRSSW